ncbi:MAG: tRNA pseudouridine(55) synthase TruB [Rhodospirillales bacterium]|nr:tRNA pseudouridine(55) synthase TruB [Rhodospirillales bacterium]
MGRKVKGRALHGWLVVDKPSGLTSTAVVNRVRAMTNAAKIGHGGTLDPLATGVLPLALGEATKTVSYAMDGLKSYRFTVRWGEERTTDDSEGEVTKTTAERPTKAAIEAALPAFEGDIEQVPPTYSAIKVAGERAYALARADKPVELQSRKVHIRKFTLDEMPDPDHAIFDVESGRGAYMRSLARDLGRALGVLGHVAQLRRTRVGSFTEAQAISLEKLAAIGHSEEVEALLLPIETALDDIPALALTEVEARHLKRGQPVPVLPVVSRSPSKDLRQGAVVCVMSDGKPVALARINGGEIRPLRVLYV